MIAAEDLNFDQIILNNMEGNEKWYFTKEQLCATPSRKAGIDADKELSYRQQAATLIQDMGQRLQVTQLCINTAIVYMHRFYMFHSFTKFHRNMISSCALFLAAKVEEQPRKLEHVIKMSHACLYRETQPLDPKSEEYSVQASDLVMNENFMLQTLGFGLAVQHPHTSVVNCCQLVRASKDLAQTSYFMATNSLHLTTMCLQYKPTVVACVCIHLACKWSNWEIPRSSEGKDWFYYVDQNVNLDLLERLTKEFLAILDKCPSRLKRKILAGGSGSSNGPNNSIPKSITENDKKNSSAKIDAKMLPSCSKQTSNLITTDMNSVQQRSPSALMKKVKPEVPQQSNKIPSTMSFSAYQEMKRAQMQKDQTAKHLEQTKSNLSKQSVNPISRELNIADDSKPINYDKQSVKQNQINIDKQRQIEERNKNLIKPNMDHLFDSNTRSVNSKSSALHSQQKNTQNNLVSEEFFDNLVNKPLNNMNFNSIFNVEGEDSSDFKKEIATDLKMEFSDNDSNQSSVGLNLNAIPSAFMNDSSDSKTGLNTQSNSIADGAKTTSFMSIFSTPSTLNSPLCQPKIEKMDKAENARNNIPANVKYDALLRIKPEIPTPPPMLSPLKQDSYNATPNNHENQLLYHNSKNENSLPINKMDAVMDPKPSVSTMQSNNSKVTPIIPKSKSPQKNRLSQKQQKNLIGHINTHQMVIKKEKEVPNVPQMPQITVKKERDFSDVPPMPQITIKKERDINVTDVTQNAKIPEVSISSQLNNSNYYSAMKAAINSASILPKSDFKEIMSKPIDIPSVNASKQLSSNSTSIDFGIKQYTELPQKSAFNSCPSPQTNINNVINVNNISSIDVCDNKAPLNNKDKQQHSHEHQDRYHHRKSHHHSHKSSKHKEKRKHKHKDKDREKDKDKDKDKHKRKDKDRDREKRNKTKDNDSSFKIAKTEPIDDYEQTSAPREAIKLKILKRNFSVDEPEKSDTNVQNSLKLRIQLNAGETASVSPVGSNNVNSSRKRKSSPKASKKEKIAKYDNETHICDNTTNEEVLKSKKAKSSQKKGSNDLMNDKNASKSDTKPMVGMAHTSMRSSKASHK